MAGLGGSDFSRLLTYLGYPPPCKQALSAGVMCYDCCRQVVNLVTWDASKFDSTLSRLSPTKGVPGDPRGFQCTSFFLSPIPCDDTVKERPLSYVLIDISLLPTFHFLPPSYISARISLSSLLFRAISPSPLLCTSPVY